MFEKNDKSLLWMRVITNVLIFIIAAASVLSGIILSITLKNAMFLFIAVGGIFLSFFAWVVVRLFLSYLCDIKLIRNKLYGIENSNLKGFLGGENSHSPVLLANTVRTRQEKERERLKSLLDAGVITEKEYQQEIDNLQK